MYLYWYVRYTGKFLQHYMKLYRYCESSHKYQLSLFNNQRHVITLAQAGFEPMQRVYGIYVPLPWALTIRPPDRGYFK